MSLVTDKTKIKMTNLRHCYDFEQVDNVLMKTHSSTVHIQTTVRS